MCDGDIMVISVRRHQIEGDATFGGEAHANTYVTVGAEVLHGIVGTGTDPNHRTCLFCRHEHIAERTVKRDEFG